MIHDAWLILREVLLPIAAVPALVVLLVWGYHHLTEQAEETD